MSSATRQHRRLACNTPWATYVVEEHTNRRAARRVGLLGATTHIEHEHGTWRRSRDGRPIPDRHAQILDQLAADLAEPT
ncbi:MAG: hypothetical protein JHD16_00335 [Solirubrobacteraceae bacterium]|nr:hypothetical protein [Solirubrobacteraceae bacterium]